MFVKGPEQCPAVSSRFSSDRMAKMFPERLPKDVESEAERRLFERFQRDFSDEFAVFHGVAWLSRRRNGGTFDGEADFIVAHPRHGLLVLEVKGGGISYDGALKHWQSIDRHGVPHDIKDPVAQARNSRYALQRKLREADYTARYAYPLAHAVVFPDTEFTVPPTIDLSPEIVIDLPKVRDLKQSVIDAYRSFRGNQPDPGDEAIGAVITLLAPSWTLPPLLSATVEAQEERVRELTEQQFGLLDVLRRQRRVLISGGAGTGKTMLAMEKARRLTREGFRVLLTCFNRNLAAWMEHELAHTGVEVWTFHALCAEFARRAGTPIERAPDEPDQAFFDRHAEALDKAAALVKDRYDAIIVDEGQDFEEIWWVPLLELLDDGNDGILYIFYDDNQRIYRRRGEFPIAGPPYSLTQNCRNTQQIHEVVSLFYRGDQPATCKGPAGQPPVLIEPLDGESERDAAARHVSWLIEEQKVRPQDIVILTPHRKDRSVWRNGSEREWQLTWDPGARAGVLCSTIHAFKGLERPVVIVTELADVSPAEKSELLYVAFSRARQYLAVLGLDLDAVAAMQASGF